MWIKITWNNVLKGQNSYIGKTIKNDFFFKDQPRIYINKSIEVDKKPSGDPDKKNNLFTRERKLDFQ